VTVWSELQSVTGKKLMTLVSSVRVTWLHTSTNSPGLRFLVLCAQYVCAIAGIVPTFLDCWYNGWTVVTRRPGRRFFKKRDYSLRGKVSITTGQNDAFSTLWTSTWSSCNSQQPTNQQTTFTPLSSVGSGNMTRRPADKQEPLMCN
jgi:hypothetical protein